MKANRKFKEDVGVSAVLGIIIMIAIVVVIAAAVWVYVTEIIVPEEKEFSGILHKVKSHSKTSTIVIGNQTLEVHGKVDCLTNLIGQDITIIVTDYKGYYMYKGVVIED